MMHGTTGPLQGGVIKSNQIKSNQIKSNQIMFISAVVITKLNYIIELMA